MIYMVEHLFALPEMEADWNVWYQQNVANLMTVPGFASAQRFKVENTSPPRYMAMYTVTTLQAFECQEYRNVGGGGNASVRFRPAYKYWRRSLWDTPRPAPAAAADQTLAVVDRAEPTDSGFEWMKQLVPPKSWLLMAGLAELPGFRGLAVAPASRPISPRDVTVYTPIAEQLHNARS